MAARPYMHSMGLASPSGQGVYEESPNDGGDSRVPSTREVPARHQQVSCQLEAELRLFSLAKSCGGTAVILVRLWCMGGTG